MSINEIKDSKNGSAATSAHDDRDDEQGDDI